MRKKRSHAQIEADAKRTGRPPMPAKERRQNIVVVRITDAERVQFERLARDKGVTLSEILMLPWRSNKGEGNEGHSS